MFWFGLSMLAAAADLLIKRWARNRLGDGQTRSLAKGKVSLTLLYNKGAFLGWLKNRTRLLAGGSLLAVGILIGLLGAFCGRRGNVVLRAGLALLLGGAVSNVLERLSERGEVTDYIRFNVGPKRLRRIVFNLGDFCIFTGGILGALGSLLP